MQNKGSTQLLTEKEINEELKKKKEMVAKMPPLFDNNKHYREVVNRSKGIEDNVIVDPSLPPTEEDLNESIEAIRVLEMEINKLKRDKEKTEKYHQSVMRNKLQELREEIKEKNAVERALSKEKLVADRATKRVKNDKKKAKNLGITYEQLTRIKNASYYIPENFRVMVVKKAKEKNLSIGLYLFLMLKKELEAVAEND
jgi:FtsZ-binding cell division protein ZapB